MIDGETDTEVVAEGDREAVTVVVVVSEGLRDDVGDHVGDIDAETVGAAVAVGVVTVPNNRVQTGKTVTSVMITLSGVGDPTC